jgi:DNA-binding MarR family transcriptional regulator
MFERCLYFNVNSLTRAVNRIWEDAFAEFDLSPSHAYLLRVVLSHSGLTPKQISLELKLEKSTVTRFLDALEKKGFIRRRKSLSGDAREQGIYPTAKSQKIADKLERTGDELYQKMIDTIGKNALTSLVYQLRDTEQHIK